MLGGDCNAPATSPELAWLDTHAVLSVRNAFGPAGPCPATHPLPPRADRPGRCIDFLFTVGPRGEMAPVVRRASVALDSPINGVWPSDHAALVADFDCIATERRDLVTQS